MVLVGGALALYVERGGRTLLTFSDDLRAPLEALATVFRQRRLGRLMIEKADGVGILAAAAEATRSALEEVGFVATSRGLRLGG